MNSLVKEKPPLEKTEQIDFVNWFRSNYPGVRILHYPSGSIIGGRNKFGMIALLKQMGWVAGVPDLFIPEWNVWIEFKRVKGSKPSPEQRDFIDYLNSCGHSAFVAYGAEQAKAIIKDLDTVNLRYSLGK